MGEGRMEKKEGTGITLVSCGRHHSPRKWVFVTSFEKGEWEREDFAQSLHSW